MKPGTGSGPAILLRKPDAGTMERMHWSIGDVQAREIDGETYMFRCIDETMQTGRKTTGRRPCSSVKR